MFGRVAPKINRNITFDTNYKPTIGDPSNNFFTLNQQNGTYCQIGNMIFFQSNCQWTSKGSASSTVRLSLPFAIGNSNPNISCEIGYSKGIGITGNYLVAIGVSGNSFITFQGISNGGLFLNVGASACATTGILQVGGFYWIN